MKHNLAVNYKHLINQSNLYELLASMYLSKAKQIELEQVQSSVDLSLLLSAPLSSNPITSLVKEQSENHNKMGKLFMHLISHNSSLDLLYRLFQDIPIHQDLSNEEIEIEKATKETDLLQQSICDVPANDQPDELDQKEDKYLKSEQIPSLNLNQALNQKTNQNLSSIINSHPKSGNNHEANLHLKEPLIAEIVREIELPPTQPKTVFSDEDLMKGLYLNTFEAIEPIDKQNIIDRFLKDLAESPIKQITDSHEFAEQFKHIQRWSDRNKLKSWTTQSKLIKETGLKYLSARLNYLQSLPHRVRPAHAWGEGAYRATRNQLKGSAKSLRIEGLTIDHRLITKDWLNKAKKYYKCLVKALRQHLYQSEYIAEQNDPKEPAVGYNHFIELPEVIELQHAIDTHNDTLIKSEVHNVVKANICSYDDPRLGYLLSSLNHYKKLFSGRSNKILRASISKYVSERKQSSPHHQVQTARELVHLTEEQVLTEELYKKSKNIPDTVESIDTPVKEQIENPNHQFEELFDD
ncbi:MAG: hypothetical protein CMH49_05210 [Myxococcales bacterium]|nr:hypothetical protein [Myxococcales bacterium]